MNLNTVMLPVYWDLIEPEEGKFDFSLVAGAIDRARHHGLHLVYLWFGTWKNSMSCYAPGWVKRDTARFERVKQSSGETMEIISPQSTAANEADARAFASLMRWTKDYDAKEQTVIMVQVENEIGMIPEPRDHSEKSESAYKSDVPGMLLSLAAAGRTRTRSRRPLGKGRPENRTAHGAMSSAPVRRERRYFQRGSLQTTSKRSPPRARRNIRCRCTPMPP